MKFIALMPTMGYNKNSMAAESWRTRNDALDILYLPPPEVWLFNPERDGRLPTPVDEYGFVDVDAFIEIGKSTVAPEFNWKLSEKPDIHHLYWERNRYPNRPQASVNPYKFCILPTNQIIIPRLFHNWAHFIFAEPDVPSDEAMASRIEEYDTKRMLFRTAKQSIDLTRARYMPEEKLLRGFEHHLWDFLITVEEAQNTPSTIHTINLAEYDPSTTEELHALAKFLGEAVTIANRARDVRSTFIPNRPRDTSATLVS